jgi:hypothetical protein
VRLTTPRSSRQATRAAIDDLSAGYCARPRPPRSGLSRRDLVPWPVTSLSAVQHHTRFWGNSRHGRGAGRPCAHIPSWSGDRRRLSKVMVNLLKHGTTEVPRPAAPPPCGRGLTDGNRRNRSPMGARRPRPRGSGPRATGHSPPAPGANKGCAICPPLGPWGSLGWPFWAGEPRAHPRRRENRAARMSVPPFRLMNWLIFR